MSKLHKQKWTKVNAPVDEGVSELVSALSLFRKLQTLESCEGPPAWVCFKYGSYWDNEWMELSRFLCGFFGVALARLVGDAAQLSIQLTASGTIRGELIVRPRMMAATIRAIEHLAREYNGLRSAV
ncbi:MAG: hypothetical protein FJ217_07725 [Ignavibacteria bacterium]|nr:hypothetical protein [Ignavibacteria bacterium]